MLLAAGMGTRLQSIFPNTPKALVPYGKQTLLEIILNKLESQGFKRIVLCVGYLAKLIEDWVKKNYTGKLEIIISKENKPQGRVVTILKAIKKIKTDDFLIVNADLLFDFNFKKLIKKHVDSKSLATLTVHPSDHVHDSDLIINKKNRIIKILPKKSPDREKVGTNCNLTSAGIYVFSKKIVKLLKISDKVETDLERDVLVQAISNGHKINCHLTLEYIKDMGTPERYEDSLKYHLNSKKSDSRSLA